MNGKRTCSFSLLHVVFFLCVSAEELSYLLCNQISFWEIFFLITEPGGVQAKAETNAGRRGSRPDSWRGPQ